MSMLSSALLTKDVHLGVRASDPQAALAEILQSLRNDERVVDWTALCDSLSNGSPIDCGDDGNGMMILHHRRTSSISGMVLASGRLEAPLPVAECPSPLRMIFVAAIPESLDNEYLRILGAVSRICGDPVSFGRLMAAPDERSFIAILEEGCRR